MNDLPASGSLLGGRVLHDQAAGGFRSGIEPVLLAAAVPAGAGDRVIECGTGSGAALLCLAARVGPIAGVGIEIDPTVAAHAAANLRRNGFGQCAVVAGNALEAVARSARFDHAMANPPYFQGGGTVSPDARRAQAKHAGPGEIGRWVDGLATRLRPRGTITLVAAAACLPEVLAGLTAAACGSVAILPLRPMAGRDAKLLIVQGVRGGGGPCRVLPDLVLHEASGRFTAAAQSVLRDARPLPLGPAGRVRRRGTPGDGRGLPGGSSTG